MAAGTAKIAALTASSGWKGSRPEGVLGLGSDAEALDQLAEGFEDAGPLAAGETVEAGALGLPRIVVLDALVKFFARPRLDSTLTDEIDAEMTGEIERLLAEMALRAGVPETEASEAATLTYQALESIVPPGPESGSAWEAFAEAVMEPLRLTRAEVEKPRCDDTAEIEKSNHSATGVTVDFYVDTPPGEMLDFCNPEKWHELSAFQRAMAPIGSPKVLSNGWWRRDLEETVELAPTMTLTTKLRFSYSRDHLSEPRWAHLDYVLLEQTKKIGVDEGSLDLRLVTSGKHRGRTRVTAKKAICFLDPALEDWTTIACDTFWTDTVVSAALSAADGGT